MVTIRPKLDIEQLFKRGTDLNATGRFQETLAYNHFQAQDHVNLQDLHKKLQSIQPSIQEIFNRYLTEISPVQKNQSL